MHKVVQKYILIIKDSVSSDPDQLVLEVMMLIYHPPRHDPWDQKQKNYTTCSCLRGTPWYFIYITGNHDCGQQTHSNDIKLTTSLARSVVCTCRTSPSTQSSPYSDHTAQPARWMRPLWPSSHSGSVDQP